MKNLVGVIMILFSASVFAGNGKMKLGEKADLIHIKMLDVSGEKISIADAALENGVLVLFSCNTCPFVMRWEGRYPELKNWAEKNKVGMIVLNSNYQKRNGDDSFENMKKHATEKGYNFSYVVDEESQIANAFGGQVTPHAFLFNNEMELVYKGAIDDSYESAESVKKWYVKDAISSLAKGNRIELAETKPTGCGIKRKLD